MNSLTFQLALDSLQKSNNLKTQESLDLISKWVIAKCNEDHGFVDDINTYENINCEKFESFSYYSNPDSKEINTLYFFNHGGVDTPNKFVDFIKLDSWMDYAKCIYDNYDLGTRKVADELVKQLSKNSDLNYSIIFFDTTRIVADSNRLRRSEQLVEKPYRGESIWSNKFNFEQRSVVAENLIDPFFAKIKELVLTNKVKLVFNPHSYDTYGGGNSSSNHEKASAEEKRPPFTLLKKYAFETESFGTYDSRESIDLNLLEESEINLIIDLLNKKYKKFKINDLEKKVTVDYPYISPRMLGGLVRSYFNGPVFVTDIRKDLFKNEFENIMACLDEIRVILNS